MHWLSISLGLLSAACLTGSWKALGSVPASPIDITLGIVLGLLGFVLLLLVLFPVAPYR